MSAPGILRKVDAFTVRVPDIDAGVDIYVGVLGHRVKWRNDAIGEAWLELPDGHPETVLAPEHGHEPNWLVESVDAVEVFRSNGGHVIAEPFDIPVGRLGVDLEAFGNPLVVLDFSNGTFTTDETGDVDGVSG